MKRLYLIVILALSGCVDFKKADGSLRCSAGEHACPGGYACGTDGFCWRTQVTSLADLGAARMCSNGVLDLGETDVDCGGSACAPCALGKSCNSTSDCATSACDLTLGQCVEHCEGPAGNVCVPSDCSAPAVVTCVSQIANAVVATMTRSCNVDKTGYVYGPCMVQSCQSGYALQSNECLPEPCPPGATSTIDCSSQKANSVIASATQTCNDSGTDFTYGACTIESCRNGYVLQANSCVPQSCTPGAVSSVDCASQKPNSAVAAQTQTCNASGTDYTYGSCNVQSCVTGYQLQSNSCVPQACTPGSTSAIDCSSQKPNSQTASQPRVCNSTGSDYTYGTCTVQTCKSGYALQSNSCVVQSCTPGTMITIACASANASSATQTQTCNASGTGYTYGACTVQSCQSGYHLQNNSCVAYCVDGIKDNGEIGIDCGSGCGACPDGQPCAGSDANCLTGHFCSASSNLCVASECADSKKDGSETDIDCGGTCGGCGLGKQCSANSDCASGICDAGTCRHFVAETVPSIGGEFVYRMWASAANDMWAAAGAVILHSDGSGTWTAQVTYTGYQFTGIWGARAGGVDTIYVAGRSSTKDLGTILRSTNSGTSWTETIPAGTWYVRNVWGNSPTAPTDLYAVGGGFILHSTNGTSWTQQTSLSIGHWVNDVVGLPNTTTAYAVGEYDSAHMVNIQSTTNSGSTWSKSTAPTSAFNGIAGSGSDFYAVGASGAIVHFQNGTWTAETSGVLKDLHGVWAGPTGIYAVGDSGTFLRRNANGSWSSLPTGALMSLRSVLVTSNGLYIGGNDSDDGIVMRLR